MAEKRSMSTDSSSSYDGLSTGKFATIGSLVMANRSKAEFLLEKTKYDLLLEYIKKLNDDLIKTSNKRQRKELLDQIKEASAEAVKIQAGLDESAEKAAKNVESAFKSIASKATGFLSLIESMMNDLISSLQAMAYNLTGTEATLQDVTSSLSNALAGTGLVKQLDVYKNLTTLIKDGIVRNSEQRAYLATIAEDFGMNFNALSSSLNRLILIQGSDLTSNRLAIQASLKEFLNQNYQTSQYIKEGFEQVSETLLQAQSLLSAEQAVALESTVQKWSGVLLSAGMSTSTVQSIATALGQLGSGNISSLNGSALQRLLIMGANNATNLSYGDLLMGGLSAELADELMTGVVKYISGTIGDAANNNVVKSELARVFGIEIADVVAAANVDLKSTTGSTIGSNINELLSKLGGWTYTSTLLEKIYGNAMYNRASSIASSDAGYTIYKLLTTGVDIASALTTGIKTTLGGLVAGAEFDVSDIISAIPGLALMTDVSGIAGISTIGKVLNRALNGSSVGELIYNILGDLSKLRTAGSGFTTISGLAGSAVMVAGNESSDDITNQSLNSAKGQSSNYYEQDPNEKDTTDIYNLLESSHNETYTLLSGINTSIEDKLSSISTIIGASGILGLMSELNTNISTLATGNASPIGGSGSTVAVSVLSMSEEMQYSLQQAANKLLDILKGIRLILIEWAAKQGVNPLQGDGLFGSNSIYDNNRARY